MAYSEAVLQRAQARLAQARQQHDEETRSRIEAIYAQQPRLRQIDQTLRQTAARIMAVSFRRGEDPAAAMAELKKENLALQQERDWLLESNDIDPDDLSPAPLCPRCGGTGYVGAVMCDCLRELCRQEQKKELSQLLGSGKESFEHFRLDLYPAEYDPKLGASPRKLMQYVYNNALHYARTFTLESGSILMIGATGLGKTFLSACIARTVADRGYSVLYSTAMQLFSDFETAKFARSRDLLPQRVQTRLRVLFRNGDQKSAARLRVVEDILQRTGYLSGPCDARARIIAVAVRACRDKAHRGHFQRLGMERHLPALDMQAHAAALRHLIAVAHQ